jgi:hypothetical protein
MKASSNLDLSIPNPSLSTPAQTTPANSAYAPSVPMKVYRELAAELQNTRATLDSVHQQNQHLMQQNLQLRQEIERVIKVALDLQQVLGLADAADAGLAPDQSQVDAAQLAHQIRSSRSSEMHLSEIGSNTILPEKRSAHKALTTKPLNGLWLTLLIAAIIITAFGAGFFIVRPLLPKGR